MASHPSRLGRARQGLGHRPLLRCARKLRWGLAGRGKRGGIRVIYFLRLSQGEVWMLTLYAKNEVESIPGHVLRRIKEEIDGGA